jgi:hypothetical protein
MINAFLDWAQEQPDGMFYLIHSHHWHLNTSNLVWIVNNEQLLAWVQNPVPVSQLNSVNALKCSTPNVPASLPICNGIPQNENGLLDLCDFSDFPFYTCVRFIHPQLCLLISLITLHLVKQYGCPETEPTPGNPNPPQQVAPGQQARFRC